MNCNQLVEIVENRFETVYPHFKEFQTDERFSSLWNLCIETVKNPDHMRNIIFCNDMYQMPPVKVFIDINRGRLKQLETDSFLFEERGKENYLRVYVKQCLGAFWGMVFRKGLGYEDRKTATVVATKYYGVRTASYFIDGNESIR